MIRSVSFMSFATVVVACSAATDQDKKSDASAVQEETAPPAKNPLDLVPTDTTLSGWTVDRSLNSNPNAEPMTGTTIKGVERLIDGAATPFFIEPYAPKLFVWQNYVNMTLPAALPDGAFISMYLLQMPSAEQASGLYTSLLKLSEYNRKQGTADDWKPTSPPLGDEARIEDTGSTWWINFHKGEYYVEIVLSPSTGPAPDFLPGDADTKNEAMHFAKAVADKM
jgi:hypothetical protein